MKIDIRPFFYLLVIVIINSCDSNEPVPPKPPGYQEDIPWPSLADSPWPIVGGSPQRANRSRYNGSDNAIIDWELQFSNDIKYNDCFTHMIIDMSNNIYLIKYNEPGKWGSNLYSIGSDGKINWTFPITSDTTIDNSGNTYKNTCPPLINKNGNIFVSSREDILYSISLDGQLLWKKNFPAVWGIMNVDMDLNMYIVARDGILYSMNTDGHINWTLDYKFNYSTSSSITFSPDGNTMYIPGDFSEESPTIYAVSKEGKLRWQFDNGGKIHHSPLVDSEGHIYISPQNPTDTINAGFICLNSDGTIKYKNRNIDYNNVWASPAIDKLGNIYVPDFELTSLDYEGNLRWRKNFGGNSFGGSNIICDANNNIYFYNESGELCCIDNNSTLKYKLALNRYGDTSPIIGRKGEIYITTYGQKNTLHKID